MEARSVGTRLSAFPSNTSRGLRPLCPAGRPAPGPTRRSLPILAVALAIATPTYWLGSLLNCWVRIRVGVGVRLAARFSVTSNDESATDGARRHTDEIAP